MLIEAIKQEQKERMINDSQLARLLGVDLSTWSRIRRGQRRPGGKFLRAVMKNLPEVSMAVIDYLRNEHGHN
jgi:transcriptional regulator with XRE-family HTH domain